MIFLLVEFFDELHYGLQSAAIPSIRLDLALTYAQIGLLFGLPKIVNTFVEPLIMLLGDSATRKRLVIGGGLTIVLAILLISSAVSFAPLLIAFLVSYPASGAFVSLSQATLMDLNPGREPHSMARWTVAGSLGNLLGPALLAGAFAIGLGWRLPYLGLALLALGLTLIVWRQPFPAHLTLHPARRAADPAGAPEGDPDDRTPDGAPNRTPDGAPDRTPDGKPDSAPDGKPDSAPDRTPGSAPDGLPDGVPDGVPGGKPEGEPGSSNHPPSLRRAPAWMWANLLHALRVKALLRWVGLLEMSDLLLDVFTSYAALYLADVVGLTPAQTGLALTALMLTSLASDLLLIPLLERVPGRTLVRASAACAIPLFIAFMLAPWPWLQVVMMLAVRASTLGWYSVLQGEAYASVPGRSGTVMAVNSAAGLATA